MPGKRLLVYSIVDIDVVTTALLVCRAVVRPHIELEICVKHKYHKNVYT